MSEPASLLVTGAAGFFGLALVRALANEGHEILATDRVAASSFSPRPGTPGGAVRYIERDLEHDSIDDLLADVDAVVHAAALTPGAESGENLDRLLAINLGAVAGVLRGARASERCGRIVYISSAGVYDQEAAGTLAEEQASGGSSLYGAAKLAAELVVGRYSTLAGLQFCSLRPTSLFGPGEQVRPSRPRLTSFRLLVDAAARGTSVRIENTHARADWLHVDDAADAVVLLLKAPRLPGLPLNLSSGLLRPFQEVVDAVAAVAPLRLDEQAGLVISGGSDRAALIGNDRLRSEIDWLPRRTFADAVAGIAEEEGLLAALEPARVQG